MAFILHGTNPKVQSPVALPLWKSNYAVTFYISLNSLSRQYHTVLQLQSARPPPSSWPPPSPTCHRGACGCIGSLEVMDHHPYDILQSKCESCPMETGKPTPLPSATRQRPALLRGTIWSQPSIYSCTFHLGQMLAKAGISQAQSSGGRQVKEASLIPFWSWCYEQQLRDPQKVMQ